MSRIQVSLKQCCKDCPVADLEARPYELSGMRMTAIVCKKSDVCKHWDAEPNRYLDLLPEHLANSVTATGGEI